MSTSGDVLLRGLRILGNGVRQQPRMFAIAVTGSALFGVLLVANAYLMGAVVGRVVAPAFERAEADNHALTLAVGAILGVSLLRVASIFGRRLSAGIVQFRLQATYRRQVTRRYLELPLAWHQRNSAGALLSNATSDVEATCQPMAPLPFAVGTVVMLCTALVSLFLTDWTLALVGVALFPILFGMNVLYSRRMSPRQIRAQQLRAGVSQIAHESFDGALVVKTMGREGAETERFAVRVAELRDTLISVGRLRGLFDPVMEMLPSIGTLCVLLIGAWRLRSGDLTVAELVSVAFLFTILAFPMRAIAWLVADLPRSVAGWDRVSRVLTAVGKSEYGEGTLAHRAGEPATLSFERVRFAYADAAPVLHDVSFTVPAGRVVALVGPTGAGKSTIASLAVRLVDAGTGADPGAGGAGAGTVRLDGVDVRSLSAEALASSIALVPQLPFVFDDTVRANVTLDRPRIDDAAVWAALRLAQADRFVENLPEGLDTAVGERGTSLSGGQRQRLTLARALAGAPRLLILDDATSAVDPRVEAAILAALRSGAGTRASILVVAYRRATIALADEVIYLEQGRVRAHGTHAQLLATEPGYADLVTAYEQAEKMA